MSTASHRAVGPIVATPSPATATPHAMPLQDLQGRREQIATAALQGLLASLGSVITNAPSAEQIARRSVRYADALIEALNTTTAEALHARAR